MEKKERRQRYINDCPSREEFYKFLGGEFIISSSDSSQKERFSDYSLKMDSLDYTIYNIFYPLPLVKEIYIKNYAGGWEGNQNHIHFEYWDYKWKMKKIIKNKKESEEVEKIITKEDIFPEIISFIGIVDSNKSKEMLRAYNINQLL